MSLNFTKMHDLSPCYLFPLIIFIIFNRYNLVNNKQYKFLNCGTFYCRSVWNNKGMAFVIPFKCQTFVIPYRASGIK